MNARLLLLALVTATFMAAWDGDGDAMQAALARRTLRQQSAVAALAVDQHQAAPLVSFTGLQLASEDASSTTVECHASDCVLPIPEELAAGDYQVVSQSGETHRIRISSNDVTPEAHRDFYMKDGSDGSRWYYIRISSP